MMAFSATASVTGSSPLSFAHDAFDAAQDYAYALARRAFAAARGLADLPRLDETEWQETSVIRSVAAALTRAFKDASFGALSDMEQEDAAVMLTCQCLYGLRVATALHNALFNPATMAQQLKSNALRQGDDGNVFEHIARAHLPQTTVTAPSVRRLRRMEEAA